MATESQTSQDANISIGESTATRDIVGQKITVTDRTITAITFKLMRIGSPDGNLYFRIYNQTGYPGTLIYEELLMANSAVSNSSPTDYTLTFAAPQYLNQGVRLVLYSSNSQAGSNYTLLYYKNANVKSGEYLCFNDLTPTPVWDGPAGVEGEGAGDAYYSYEYDSGYTVPINAPVVTTQAVSAVAATTATGNGNVTSRGVPLATEHGHVVATFQNPTIANYDFITTNGVPAATGAYTSSLTGLTQNTLYYVRSYITNTAGTFYGQPVSFTTSGSTAVVTTKQPTSVLTTTAVGEGSIDNLGGTAVTAFGVCWSTSANPTTGDSHTDEGAGVVGDFYTAITGLTAGTLYHVRAYATNTWGTSYGSDLTFTTEGQGVPIVTIEPTTSITPTSAAGNGTIVDIGASAVTQYGHCWSTSVNPTTADSKTTLGAGVAGAFISTITGLTAGTGYYIRAYATNAQGTAYSDNELINDQTGGLIRTFGVLGEHLVYLSKTNKQRAILGTEF